MTLPVIHVVAGTLDDGEGRLLLAQRPPGSHLAGAWEFPGGKLEPGEDVFDALHRGELPPACVRPSPESGAAMMTTRLSLVFAACLVAGTAVGQTAKKSLDLDLSPGDVPAATGSSSAANAFPVSSGSVGRHPAPPAGHVVRASAGSTANVAPERSASDAKTPGVWYGDHSTDLAEDGGDVRPGAPPCDDSTYNQPQVHGSVSTGIISASHIGTGSYSGGVVNVSKAFGSCEQPAGGISISVGGTTSNGFGRHWGH